MSASRTLYDTLYDAQEWVFCNGLALELAQAVNTWRKRPYDDPEGVKRLVDSVGQVLLSAVNFVGWDKHGMPPGKIDYFTEDRIEYRMGVRWCATLMESNFWLWVWVHPSGHMRIDYNYRYGGSSFGFDSQTNQLGQGLMPVEDLLRVLLHMRSLIERAK